VKPTITNIQGSSPSGMGTPSTDNQAQSLEVNGTGFTSNMLLLIEGPDPKDRSKQHFQLVKPPSVQVPSDTLMLAVVLFPIDSNGPHQAIVIDTTAGITSEWFSFSVN
jgi:hypothetical protein